ncbi:MAG: lipopolysaccharide biosynthesis protein [Bacteroidetes bacterium]|jgi:O-antigen/teichoic acid export membrane protein|nr:lipopolysaccharide biosynthesis protein [Bacteroidota bacterium]
MGETLKEKTSKGLFWGGVSNGLQQLVGLSIGVVLMKLLSLSDYGIVGILAIFTGIAGVIQESGFTAALINRKKIVHEDFNSIFWFNIFISLVLYLILFFSAPLIAYFCDEPKLTYISRVVFLSFFFGSLGIAHNAILLKKLMVKQRAIIDTVALTASGIASIIMAVKGMGYWALVTNQLLFSAIGTTLRWYFSGWKPSLSFQIGPIKEMGRFSSKLLVSNIVAQIQANMFTFLLGHYYAKTDVGIFSQGTKWANMGTTFIRGMINGVAQPVFAITTNEKERQALIFRKTIRFISFLSFPLLLGIAFISKEFITLIDVKWLPCVPILQMFCCTGILASLQFFYSQLIISHGKSNAYFANTVAICIIQIILAGISLRFGIYYLALSSLVTTFAYHFVWQWLVGKLIPVTLWQTVKDAAPYLLITLGVFGLTWLIVSKIEANVIRLMLKVILGASMYVLVMWRSKSVIFRESIDFFLKKNKR